MEAEAQRILESAEYQLVWRSLADRDGSESFDNLAVIRFSGACAASASSVATPGDATDSLAETAVSDGRVLPFSVVRCDRIAGLLSERIGSLPTAGRDGAFGRALGRVVAHELFHILSRTKGHQTAGVSKACFSATDLLKPAFRFTATAVTQIRPEGAEEAHSPGEVWSDEPTGR
ncbi:MAG: hypothetical protein R2729_26280 [Bryobacteraceae bacterium]